jgi:hypothetical protein
VAPEGYLHRVLADGTTPFRYRRRVRALLGLPAETCIRTEFVTPTWSDGFVYRSWSTDPGDSPSAQPLWFDVAAAAPVYADPSTSPSPRGGRTPPPTPQNTPSTDDYPAVHHMPVIPRRFPAAAAPAVPATDTGVKTDGAATTAPADLVVHRPESTSTVTPKSIADSISQSDDETPAAAPISPQPTATVPGHTTLASGTSARLAAPTDDPTTAHDTLWAMPTAARRIPIAPSAPPITDTAAHGGSAPNALGVRTVRPADTRSNVQSAPFATATPAQPWRADQPAASHHREPVRAGDYPGPRVVTSVGPPYTRPRPDTRTAPQTVRRTGESPPHAVTADPPATAAPAPADQRRTVTIAAPNAERVRAPAFWERRHIHWLRLRPLR